MKELLQKYFEGNISAEEAEELRQYFASHTDELERYFSEEEWETEKYDLLQNDILESAKMDDWFKTQERSNNQKKRFYTTLAACACLVLLLGAGWFLLDNKHRNFDTVNQVATSVYENNGKATQSVILPDSSHVTLFPHTKIVLSGGYNITQRHIELYGKAVFDVHKDANRKFTVYSGNVATTAVGTVFSVDNSKDKGVDVRLIEGKILVQEKQGSNKSYYLLPGNAITYTNKTHVFNVAGLPASTSLAKSKIVQLKNKDIVQLSSKSKTNQEDFVQDGIIRDEVETAFFDVKLPAVLKTLAKDYNVKIAYPETKASAIRFAGKVGRNEDIQKILSDIALMNNFKLEQDTANRSFRLY